jgi:hypothetical protein
MMNLVARRINDDELRTGEGVAEEQLTIWYLEQIEEELQSREQAEAETALLVKVLKRMVKVFPFLYSAWWWLFADMNSGQYHHANSR